MIKKDPPRVDRCTCCACACCACLRYARLRFPCSRCVHLLCLPLLCVPVLCAFVRCVVCLCSAHLHRVELAEPASPSTLATCHDLYPFPILSHICLLLSCIVPPSLPISCLCCSFFLFHILLHTLSCSCLRLCLRKVAQVSLSAVELPGHLFVPALPSGCLVFFFATKKKTRGRVTVPPIALWIRLFCNKSRPGNVVYGLDCSMAETRLLHLPLTFRSLLYTSLRHQADTHNRSPSPRPSTLHHSRCAQPPLPTFDFACCAPPACDLSV